MTYRICCRSYYAQQRPHTWRSAGVYDIAAATLIVATIRRQFDDRPRYLGADCWMMPA
jgi:hypothetical protein